MGRPRRTVIKQLHEIITRYKMGIPMPIIAKQLKVTPKGIWAAIHRKFTERQIKELVDTHFCNKYVRFVNAVKMGVRPKELAEMFSITIAAVHARVKVLLKHGCITKEDIWFWGTRLSPTAIRMRELVQKKKIYDPKVLARILKISPSYVFVRANSLHKYGAITDEEYEKINKKE